MQGAPHSHKSHPLELQELGAPQWRAESDPAAALSITLQQQTTGSTGEPRAAQATTPSRAGPSSWMGFYKHHNACCITCLPVHRAGAGGESVGRTMLGGFALCTAFHALGKGCKPEPAPCPFLLAAQTPPLPWHCPGITRPGRGCLT